MKKISKDDIFSNYVGKFIDVNDNGVIRKYFVSNIDSGSITTGAGILYPNTFSVLRDSPEQSCDICSDVCYQNVPVVKIIFTNYVDNTSVPEYFGGPVSDYVNDYANDTYDLYINGQKIGRIDTRDYKSPRPVDSHNGLKRNEIWFIPNYNTNLSVSYEYASASNRSNRYSFFYGDINILGLSSYNSDIFNKNSYNEIALIPISSSNPTVCNDLVCNFNPPISSAFLVQPSITLDIHKVILNENGTSALSCVSYNMHDFGYLQDRYFATQDVGFYTLNYYVDLNNPGVNILHFYKEGLSAGSIFQPFSASFFYYDPCVFQSPPYYSLLPSLFYSYTSANQYDAQFAYGVNSNSFINEQPLSNPAPPVLRKLSLLNSTNTNDIKFLYMGENRKYSPYSSQNFTTVLDNPGIFKTREIVYPFTSSFSASPPSDIIIGNTIYSDMFANELFEGDFYCLENRTNLGEDIKYRLLNVYLETVGNNTYQHLSVGPLFNL